MKFIEGVIETLGNSTTDGDWCKYTLIEVSGGILQDVAIFRGLDNFLQKALSSGESVKIYFSGKFIGGVEFESGKIYYAKVKFAKWIS